MVASKKWIKTVFGLQKGNKLQSSEQDENTSGSTEEIWLQGKSSDEITSDVIEKHPNSNVVTEVEGVKDETFRSVNHCDEVDSGIIENESAPSVITEVEVVENSNFLPMKHSASPLATTDFTNIQDPNDTTLQSVMNVASSSSTSLCEKNDAQREQNVREEWAATHIQTAFRRFMARRTLRALRGLVRLEALVTGRAVKKQAAFTLHSMQDLVKVQARVRTRRVRVGLENQIVQHKLQQQFEIEQEARVKEQEGHVNEQEGRVKETGGGWCNRAGSAEEIKAQALKRKEAAAKREKAMAYALARQWQASSRNRVKPASVTVSPEKFNWSWNWSDTWMGGSSQLENRAVDTNFEDGIKPSGNEPADAQQKPATKLTSAGKKASTDTGSSKSVRCKLGPAQELKSASSHCSSPIKSANLRETLSPRTPTRSPRSVVRDSGEVSSPRLFGVRSRSTPKERSPLGDHHPGKKRLSLPETGQSVKQLSQPAIQRSLTAPKPVKTRSKSIGSDPSNLSPQTVR